MKNFLNLGNVLFMIILIIAVAFLLGGGHSFMPWILSTAIGAWLLKRGVDTQWTKSIADGKKSPYPAIASK